MDYYKRKTLLFDYLDNLFTTNNVEMDIKLLLFRLTKIYGLSENMIMKRLNDMDELGFIVIDRASNTAKKAERKRGK